MTLDLKRGFLACGFSTIGLVLAVLMLYFVFGFPFSEINLPWYWAMVFILALVGLYSSSLLVGAYTYDRIRYAKSMVRAMFRGVLVALTSLVAAVTAGASLNFAINVWKIMSPGSFPLFWSHNASTVWSAFTTWVMAPVATFVFFGWVFWFGLGLVYGAVLWKKGHVDLRPR